MILPMAESVSLSDKARGLMGSLVGVGLGLGLISAGMLGVAEGVRVTPALAAEALAEAV